MRIVVIGPFYPATSFRFLIDAFERKGHHIIRIGPTYNDHGGIDWGNDRIVVDLELPRQAPEWDFDEVIDWCVSRGRSPDLLMVSEENYQTQIRPTEKIPTVLVSYDGWPNAFDRLSLIRPSLAYTVHPYGIRIHSRDDLSPGWRFLPSACAPWIHQDLGMERYLDFVLHATPYTWRPALCAELRHRGFSVRDGFVPTVQYVEGYNIALGTYHNAGQAEVKYRFFEAIACGCVVMSEYTELLDELGYIPNEHYLLCETRAVGEETWPCPFSLSRKLRFLKNHPSHWSHISEQGRRYTVEHHSYFNRVEQILSDLESA